MKHRLLLTLLLAFAAFGVRAQVILVEGTYQGKNLYVQNPFAGNGVGFCVYEVRVNGEVTTDEIGSSAFEIDLKARGLKQGDKVEVKIMHKSDCKPKVLNPEVVKPRSTFNTVSISVSPDNTLKWQTKDESGKLTYIIEQFRWNKWVKVGELDGTGTAGPNDYEFKITPHSGQNKFRVKQIDFTGNPRYSQKEALYTSTIPEINFSPQKADKEIKFTGETMYEIYDQYGNIVKKGFGSSIDITSLARGGYFLNYDNKTGEFFKR